MGFLGGVVSGLVRNVLPKVVSTVGNIMSSPVGRVGVDILKQLASSVFSRDGQGGVFSDSFNVTLPNPLSRLNGLLGRVGGTINNVSDFLSRIGNFLQGNRQLENGQNVNVPRLGERAATSAAAATQLAQEVGSGTYAATSSSSSANTSAPSSSSGGHIFGSIDGRAYSTEFSAEEQDMLSKIKDPAQRAQMEAQLKLQKYANLMQFVSNMMRIMGDISKGIIQNIR